MFRQAQNEAMSVFYSGPELVSRMKVSSLEKKKARCACVTPRYAPTSMKISCFFTFSKSGGV
jgi:hypothetical protein